MRYVVGDVRDAFIHEAIRMRAERDRRYGNIFKEKPTDVRWVGEIGEICFNSWARKNTDLDVEWIIEDAAGKPDFLIGGIPVGLKTVKRKVAIRDGYTAQITAQHAEEPVEHFFSRRTSILASDYGFLAESRRTNSSGTPGIMVPTTASILNTLCARGMKYITSR
ncbi:hypothetical protein [Nocardia xishanensis]